jgi:uncharacterized protein
MSLRSLGLFAIAFGLGWGLVAVLILLTSQIEAGFGPVSGTNPLFILAVYSPDIVAVLPYLILGTVQLLRRAD